MDELIISKLREMSWPLAGWSSVAVTEDMEEHSRWAGFQIAYLNMRDRNDLYKDETIVPLTWEEGLVGGIVQDYDFLAVQERMDESLVALQLLLGLDVRDILYLHSKVSGESYRFEDAGGVERCQKLVKPVISPGVHQYLSSLEWRDRIAGDMLLHHVANRCLDATIQALGRETFEMHLTTFRTYMALAQETCKDVAIWPCGPDGPRREESLVDCEHKDLGCGLRCLDDLSDFL